ncbi:hypothetical protein [Neisseria sp. Ec49-e6-T10]|uniref:hypothetical protein n=1 Tax=Neisseria sp. Ec49-e6-T10 TaxID=3140744 RepID=UPI003EBAA407
MSEHATITIKNDRDLNNRDWSGRTGSEGAIHTWLEVSLPNKDPVIISFGVADAIGTVWEKPGTFYNHPNRHFDDSISFQVPVEDAQKVIDQYINDRNNPPNYEILPNKGENFNCVTYSSHLLESININILRGISNPYKVDNAIDAEKLERIKQGLNPDTGASVQELNLNTNVLTNNINSNSLEIQKLHEKIGGYLYPILAENNVSQGHADSMVATAVQQSVYANINADQVQFVGIDKNKNLINVFSTDSLYKMASFDAIAASKNNPDEVLANAQRELDQPQQQEPQLKERSGHSIG